ncbi:uncharacterized protein BX664DRAFT_329805 [Halteromyces radiatus]|uniref:uncharacterized protein n=1 Tax=Halteromyces radiatus TaxID=101107 RepID=UPI002220CE3A|nr:uncharacterized protein BX664DRAFT_329805 [Halteromyces radiatus]KAI8093482.1 hypothetical protein BX664DRAFT_329805 [Halteromyces radiatus]
MESIDKRVKHHQKKSIHSTPISPPPSPLDTTRGKNVTIDDEGFISVTNDKRRWTDSKRKTSKTSDDPFAGMKTCINYQQEIERLKALVPKVDVKKRSSQRPTSITTISPRLIPTSSVNISSSSSHTSSSSSASSCVSLSSASSATNSPPPINNTLSNSSSLSDHDTYWQSSPLEKDSNIIDRTTSSLHKPSLDKQSVITDEEKARFLEFMRNWTGGLNGWNDHVTEKNALWRQRRTTPLSTRSEPSSPRHESLHQPYHPFVSYHLQQSHYLPTISRQQHLYPTMHQQYHLSHQPSMECMTPSSSVGTIGDRHYSFQGRVGSDQVLRSRSSNPFGVSVM